jgi:hypothetical protein
MACRTMGPNESFQPIRAFLTLAVGLLSMVVL